MSADLTKSQFDYQCVDHILLKPLQSEAIIEGVVRLGVNDIAKLDVFSCLNSTNEYLLNEQHNANEVVVCLAEQQTQGRGRYGHQWVSPAGVNLYLSMLWPVSDEQQQFEILSLWLLLVIVDEQTAYGINGIQLKWPNDICIANKKLAGILLERRLRSKKSKLVIGLGLNVAMSLKSVVKLDRPWIDLISTKPDFAYSRNEIAADLLVKFHQTLCKFEIGQLENLPEKWKHYDMLFNQHVCFLKNGIEQDGLVNGVDESGNLLIDIGGDIQHLNSANVREIKVI